MSERTRSYSLEARRAGTNDAVMLYQGKELTPDDVKAVLKKYGGYDERECDNLMMYARFISRESHMPMVFNGTGKNDKEFIKVRFVLTDTSPATRYKFYVANTSSQALVESQGSMTYPELMYYLTHNVELPKKTARKLIEASHMVGYISFPGKDGTLCTIEKRQDAQVD